ncbi:hypothetical protein [Streptomyces sp. NPDC001297]|uniref:hypothetical protein n=1 Tax=Streptomyces sp. NPDC001297 TaxID=3364559 RepID=UPI0036CCC75D
MTIHQAAAVVQALGYDDLSARSVAYLGSPSGWQLLAFLDDGTSVRVDLDASGHNASVAVGDGETECLTLTDEPWWIQSGRIAHAANRAWAKQRDQAAE